jgi:hypothetical protein
VPDDLSEDTVKLVLTNNSFPELGSKHLTSLTRLNLVDLSKNHIETIGSRVLCTSEQLEILNLNDNNIKIEKNDTFDCLKKLRRLSLKNNQISLIPQSLFKNNVDLVVLDLSYNHITFLEPRVFQQNQLLSYVIIEANPISSISNFTALSEYLNVLDIDFHGQPSVISYQRYPTLETKRNMTQVKDLLAKDLTNRDRLFIFDVLKPKLKALGYHELDYLYPNVTTRTVTTYSGAPVFCYCELFSMWYWCIDKTLGCPDMKDAFRNQTCKLHKKRDTHRTSWTANKQAEAKPILPILVLILVLSILVTF